MRNVASVALAVILAGVIVPPAMADDLKVEVVSAPASVSPGDHASLVVKTEPGASCAGTLEWKAVKGSGHSAFNFAQRKTDNEGNVTWMWTVAGGPTARGEITVTCEAGGKTGKASAAIMRQ